MNYRIEALPEIKLAGKQLTMSFAHDRTPELWKSFMPFKKLISNSAAPDLYSMQRYTNTFSYQDFDPNTPFTKWAAIAVTSFDNIPDIFETYTLQGGLYAVFKHVGSAMEFRKTFDAIFLAWLPTSDYLIDNREHFELLGEKYSNTALDSEEEIWIPIRFKN
ncbi:GyrI-like domain-containing protein [Cellulophaga baltica]|uniref:GyrI-like domain-containing protein n=1 Tax=Cellulophaga baltica TaxID=76594 RepID=UPI0024959C48|nr:GyrI-like domain-containing protein [Cellulophaga baltica]